MCLFGFRLKFSFSSSPPSTFLFNCVRFISFGNYMWNESQRDDVASVAILHRQRRRHPSPRLLNRIFIIDVIPATFPLKNTYWMSFGPGRVCLRLCLYRFCSCPWTWTPEACFNGTFILVCELHHAFPTHELALNSIGIHPSNLRWESFSRSFFFNVFHALLRIAAWIVLFLWIECNFKPSSRNKPTTNDAAKR